MFFVNLWASIDSILDFNRFDSESWMYSWTRKNEYKKLTAKSIVNKIGSVLAKVQNFVKSVFAPAEIGFAVPALA